MLDHLPRLGVPDPASWVHGEFKSSVWGHNLVSQSRDGDTWKVSFGLSYKF